MRAFTQECKNWGIFPEFVEIAVEKNSRCAAKPIKVLKYPLLPLINNGNIGYIFPRAKKQIYLTTKKKIWRAQKNLATKKKFDEPKKNLTSQKKIWRAKKFDDQKK